MLSTATVNLRVGVRLKAPGGSLHLQLRRLNRQEPWLQIQLALGQKLTPSLVAGEWLIVHPHKTGAYTFARVCCYLGLASQDALRRGAHPTP